LPVWLSGSKTLVLTTPGPVSANGLKTLIRKNDSSGSVDPHPHRG